MGNQAVDSELWLLCYSVNAHSGLMLLGVAMRLRGITRETVARGSPAPAGFIQGHTSSSLPRHTHTLSLSLRGANSLR